MYIVYGIPYDGGTSTQESKTKCIAEGSKKLSRIRHKLGGSPQVDFQVTLWNECIYIYSFTRCKQPVEVFLKRCDFLVGPG